MAKKRQVVSFGIRALKKSDRPWVADFITEVWGSEIVVTRGKIFQPAELPGYMAYCQKQPVGLITFHIDGKNCEIVTLNSLIENVGIGSALLTKVRKRAEREGCARLWLITTNDNLRAIGFYQKRGFMIAAVHRNALENSRRLKPEIPLIGMDGIALRDEVEFEMFL